MSAVTTPKIHARYSPALTSLLMSSSRRARNMTLVNTIAAARLHSHALRMAAVTAVLPEAAAIAAAPAAVIPAVANNLYIFSPWIFPWAAFSLR